MECSDPTYTKKKTTLWVVFFLAESVRFELTVGRPITSFQDWLLKPLGQLSVCANDIILEIKCQGENLERIAFIVDKCLSVIYNVLYILSNYEVITYG